MSDTVLTARETHGISDEDRESVEKIYRAIGGEVDLLDEAVTSDWLDIPSPPGQAPGPDGLKPHIIEFHEKFADAEVTIHEIIGAPGRAAVRAEMTGTQTGDWMGVPATNKRSTISMHEFHHLENGRVAKSWHMEDWVSWMRQVGSTKLEP